MLTVFAMCASWKTPTIPSKMRTLFQGAHAKLRTFSELSAEDVRSVVGIRFRKASDRSGIAKDSAHSRSLRLFGSFRERPANRRRLSFDFGLSHLASHPRRDWLRLSDALDKMDIWGPSMTLAELLEGRFRADIRFRGVAYVKAERVAVTRVTPNELFGVVRDGVEYQTQLSRHDGKLKLFCNCARTAQPESTCKHLWATILAADEGSYVSGEIRADHVPPFVSESRMRTLPDRLRRRR